MIIAILQARYSSSRLVGKVLKKIKKKTILELVYDNVKKTKEINKVIIATNTRGIVEKVEGDIMYVSFEEGKNLKFKASPTDGKYRIKSDSFDSRKRMGVVNYGNEEFFLNSTSLKSYLVFKLKNSAKRKNSARSVKGRKL